MSKTKGGGLLFLDLGKGVTAGEGPTYGGKRTFFQRLFGSSKSAKRRCRPKKQKTRKRRR
jgi:hypothetical protein